MCLGTTCGCYNKEEHDELNETAVNSCEETNSEL